MTARDGNMTSVIISKFANNSNNTSGIPEQVVDTALTFENTAVIHNDAHRSHWINNNLGIDFVWDQYEHFARIILNHKSLASSEITLGKVWQFCISTPTTEEVIETVKSMFARAHLLDYLSAYLHTNDLGTMGWVNEYGEVTVFVTERLEGATRDHKVKVRTGYENGKVSITLEDATPFAFGVISEAFSKINADLVHPDMKCLTFDADLFI